MRKSVLVAAFALTTLSAGVVAATPAAYREPLDSQSLETLKAQFRQLMDLANRHEIKAIHEMFWQSPSALFGRQERQSVVRRQLGGILGK